MNKEKIMQFAKLLGLKNPVNAGDWIQFSCPFAKINHPRKTDNHPSFGISINPNGNSSFNCFTCQVKGNIKVLPSLVELLTKQNLSEARRFVFSNEQNNYDDSIDLDFFKRDIEPMDMSLLQSFAKVPSQLISKFKLTQQIIDAYLLRYDIASKRLVFPIFNKQGLLVGFRGRLIDNNILRAKYYSYTVLHPKKQDPKTYGLWYLINESPDKGELLYLVEGERDALALKTYDFNIKVWASMGATVSIRQLHNLVKVRNAVVLFFDNDKAGQKGIKTVIPYLRNAKKVYIVSNYANCKDPAEVFEKGLMKTVLDSLKTL